MNAGWGADPFTARFSTELETYVDTLSALGIEVGEMPSTTRTVSNGNVSVGLLSVYDDGRFTVFAFCDITAAQWWRLLLTVEQIWWLVGIDTSVLDHTRGWVRSDTERRYDTEVTIDPT